ncbi:MAG: head-tail adaptor protein [Eubacteriales bacterium]|nr:head-tail adaptor protein [Eubacteriales bacterium]
MKPQNVGAMRDAVTIMRLNDTETVDRAGNATRLRHAQRTVMAMMRHQSDREYIASAGEQLKSMVYFTFRTQRDLRADDVLRVNNEDYEIEERHPLDDYGLFERIRATRVTAERGA